MVVGGGWYLCAGHDAHEREEHDRHEGRHAQRQHLEQPPHHHQQRHA